MDAHAARIAAGREELRRALPGYAAAFARLSAALETEIDELAARAVDGERIIPEIGYADLAAGRMPEALPGLVRRRGCVIVRGVFPRAQAEAWDANITAYLDSNNADARTRERIGPERYATRWKGGRPQIYSIYWSRPQVLARQAESLARTRAWLNGLWRHDGVFNPNHELTYADRVRRRSPGDTALGLRPHIDGGTSGRWLDPALRRAFTAVFAGDWEGHDPFDATYRASEAESPDANACSVFRTWQGWTALTSQGPGDGTLQVLPIAHAIAWVLLRALQNDVPAESLCGAESAPALWISSEWHASLLRGLISIPTVHPGDTVWWHPDVIHAVEDRHGGTRPSNVMYIGAVPDCPRNRAYAARQWASFATGESPPDFPADHLETSFSGRAGSADLTELGRSQIACAEVAQRCCLAETKGVVSLF
jgi:hypothetical protein